MFVPIVHKIGAVICDQCRKPIEAPTTAKVCPVLHVEVQSVDLCSTGCQVQYQGSGAERRRIEAIQEAALTTEGSNNGRTSSSSS